MPGKFVLAKDAPQEANDWGRLQWISNPPHTGAGEITVIGVTLDPGKGHDFHKHPDQEEVIHVVAGTVEQWVDRAKAILGSGDSAFIPADMVHASFNVGTGAARIVAILGPCIGATGYEVVEVAHEAPWKGLRV